MAYGGNNTAGPINVATAVRAKGGTGHGDCESETFIAFAPEVASTLVGRSSRGGGQTNSPGHNADQQIVAFNARQDPDSWTERTGPLDTDGSTQAVAFNWQQGGGPTTSLPLEVEKTPTLQRSQSVAVHTTSAVRRLTPVECERLQGFPDNFTRIPWRGRPAEECPDGPRYKAIGNSWAVDCVAWIAERLDAALEAA